jgi:hypothetical protein
MPENSVLGEKCVRKPQVDKEKILLPSLHIKLGLIENFFKAMNMHGKDSEYLREKFAKLRDVKSKKRFFIGPQSRGTAVDGN